MTENCNCSDAAFISSVEGFEAFPHLVRLIARGEPVEISEVAEIAQLPAAEVERTLRAQPGTDWDDAGRLLGFGLTLRPTEHRYIVSGRTLFTWCATDTLLFTLILGVGALVESTCPATGRQIRVELDPDAVISVEPRQAVISQRQPGAEVGNLRSEICDEGHFYSSRAAAQGWAGEHPEGEVLSVTDAFERCRQACAELGWLSARAVLAGSPAASPPGSR
ncbi:MAG: organomercurial lyase MerB [Candidatus Dormibacteria bacterium]